MTTQIHKIPRIDGRLVYSKPEPMIMERIRGEGGRMNGKEEDREVETVPVVGAPGEIDRVGGNLENLEIGVHGETDSHMNQGNIGIMVMVIITEISMVTMVTIMHTMVIGILEIKEIILLLEVGDSGVEVMEIHIPHKYTAISIILTITIPETGEEDKHSHQRKIKIPKKNKQGQLSIDFNFILDKTLQMCQR